MFGFGKPQPKPMMGQAQQMYGQNTGAKPPMMGGGLGPSMAAMGGMMKPPMGMKPPQTPPMGQPMEGVSTGMKPPVGAPGMGGNGGVNGGFVNPFTTGKQITFDDIMPGLKQMQQAQQPQGGVGPSMDALGSMMQQQPQQGQAPEAMGQQPDFNRMAQDMYQPKMKMY